MSGSTDGDEGFVLTEGMGRAVHILDACCSSLNLALSLAILLLSGWIYAIPSARHHLDRVSFRILLWSMVMEVLNGICSLTVYQNIAIAVQNPVTCGLGAYMSFATMSAANWLCTCIGVNLMLAIAFGINPIKYKLERWYIGGSIFLGFGITLIPAALGHFGYDPEYDSCFFTQPDPNLRIRDYIVDLYLWQLISCLIAAGSVAITLFTLIRSSRATKRAIFNANSLNITPRDLAQITSSSSRSKSISSAALQEMEPPLSMTRRFTRVISFRSRRSSNTLHRLEDKFMRIALKISLYPLALVFANVFLTAQDLMFTINGGVKNNTDYGLYVIYYALYGGRGIMFALLGIFVDPCLRKGVPAAWKATFRRRTSTPTDLPVDLTSELYSDPSVTPPNGGQATHRRETLGDFLGSQAGRSTTPFSRVSPYPGVSSQFEPVEIIMETEDAETDSIPWRKLKTLEEGNKDEEAGIGTLSVIIGQPPSIINQPEHLVEANQLGEGGNLRVTDLCLQPATGIGERRASRHRRKSENQELVNRLYQQAESQL